MIQSLLLTAIGGILGISGTLIASRWQAKEARQERSERYAREDRYRLAKDRLEAYSSFWLAAGEVRRQLSQGPVGEGDISSSEAMNVRNDLFREFTLIALIGDSRTRQLAGALLEYATSVARQKRLFKGGEWDDLISQFMFAGHAELVPSQLPDTEPSSPAESGALADY